MKVGIVVFFCVLSLSVVAFAQSPTTTTATSSTQALQLLQQALAALSPNIATRDVTLTGSVRYVVGSDDETGTATLKALVTGASRIDLTLPSGTRSEIRNLTGTSPTGTWISADGLSHSIALHNLLGEPAWFSPTATVSRLLSTPGSVATYVDAETLNSQSVQHVSVATQPLDSTNSSKLVSHLTQVDLYLDSSTFLPAALLFAIHPDNDAGQDIPVRILFSDYQAVAGAQVPLHIQRYINNSLFLDIQINSANLNTGIPTGTFD